jgi:hypothetical protein
MGEHAACVNVASATSDGPELVSNQGVLTLMAIVVARRLLVLICVILVIQSLSYSQSGRRSSAPASSTASLATPMDWGFFSPPLFHDNPHQVTFQLATSWIPGENHKGMLRYKLIASPAVPSDKNGAALDIESVGKLMERVHRCVITLNLYDKGGFLLRRHDVAFSFGVDDQVRVRSLYANDACQMDVQDYRDFVGNSAGSGSWNISWDCGLNP